MGKADNEIVDIYHDQVNMTADQLEAWLQSPQSKKAGTGVGLDSGHKILEIMRKNPTKEVDKYDEVRILADSTGIHHS